MNLNLRMVRVCIPTTHQRFATSEKMLMLDAGVNLGVPAPMAWFAFSGWKHSFFGDLHANGKDSVEFYTHRKVVTARYAQSEI